VQQARSAATRKKENSYGAQPPSAAEINLREVEKNFDESSSGEIPAAVCNGPTLPRYFHADETMSLRWAF